MRFTILFSSCCLGLASAAAAQTSTPVQRPMSLNECIALAVQHNLSIQIDQLGPEIAQHNLGSAIGVMYDPSLGATFRQSYNSIPGRIDATTGLPNFPAENYTDLYSTSLRENTPFGSTISVSGSVTRDSGTSFPGGFQYRDVASLNLTQPLLKNLWIDGNRLTILLDKKEIEKSELTLRQTLMTTINTVQDAYYDLMFNMENVKVQKKALELAEQLLAENKKRVEVGALAPLDEKQSESQVATSKADLLQALADLGTQQNRLRSILTDDYANWHDTYIVPTENLVAVPQLYDLQESWRKGMSARPELLKARIDVEKQDITLKYNFNQLFPQLDLTASYGYNGVGGTLDKSLNGIQQGGNQFYSYGLVLTVPLGNRDARGKYKAGKAVVQQLLLSLKKLEQDALSDIDNAVKSARTYFEKVDATRQARLYAEAALDAERKKLENGKSTSFIVLQLQKDLTAARSNEIRALADYNKSLADLAFKEGATLERANVAIELK